MNDEDFYMEFNVILEKIREFQARYDKPDLYDDPFVKNYEINKVSPSLPPESPIEGWVIEYCYLAQLTNGERVEFHEGWVRKEEWSRIHDGNPRTFEDLLKHAKHALMNTSWCEWRLRNLDTGYIIPWEIL